MPCHGCASKFGFLTKEYGCPSCGFSFCGSCLKFKTPLPKLNNKLVKVCKSCFSVASSDSNPVKMDKKPALNPPDIFVRRLEALDAPPQPPITVYQGAPRFQQLLKGLNSTDLEIVMRLKKLRAERREAQQIPTDEELAFRLAKLRDENPRLPSTGSTVAFQPPDLRSAVEQTDDLLKQTVEAVAIDSKGLQPDNEIEQRSRRLLGGLHEESQVTRADQINSSAITLDEVAELLTRCTIESGEGGAHPNLATIASLEQLRARLANHKDYLEQESTSDDETTAVQKIVAKATAEAELEQRSGTSIDESEDMEEDHENEELSWCAICNEDASIRCLSCDRDLFCKDCWKEIHQDTDMQDHVFERYQCA